jgi:polyribonucleotide nucleotidyltransferase
VTAQSEGKIHTVDAVIDNGSFGKRTVRFETGRLARQAAGSVAAYLDDDTMLLSATTAGKHPKENLDFFPLTVDVEERMYAAGRIPGSFFRREGRPSEDAILTCRLIDRPLRPTFAKGLRNEVQVVITVMALDPKDMYDVVALNAASASTQLSGLPFSGPVGATRVALVDDQWVAFPTHEQLESAVFDMVVAGRIAGDDVAIMIVEAEATTAACTSSRTTARPLPPRRSSPPASRPPSRSSIRCARPRPSWPRPRRSRRPSSRGSWTTRTTPLRPSATWSTTSSRRR